VVGNITVGGTGKTPTIIWLVNRLKQAGLSPSVVSRGYGASPKQPYPILIQPSHSAAEVGDEPKLISEKTGVPVVVDPLRKQAAEYLVNLPGDVRPDVIISDDGLQHYALPRQLELLMIDADRGFGNGQLLPAGPLREPISRLTSVDYRLAKNAGVFASQYQCQVASLVPSHAVNHRGKVLLPQPIAVYTALGNPDSFVSSLTELGYEIDFKVFFKDHATIPIEKLNQSKLPVVITEKDAVKMTSVPDNVYVIPFELRYESSFENELIQKIKDLCK
jgi:tetraacyldisaccharide 4'-kinase